MSDPPRLFCLDTLLIDVVLRVGALPERAGDTLARDQLITAGGGFNAMSAAARHGLGVVYAGRLGAGPFSSLAETALAHEHVSTPIDRNEGLDTGICVVLVEPDGERTFVTSPGAEATLRAEDLAKLDVRDGDHVLVSGYNLMRERLADVVLGWLGGLSTEVIVVFDPATRMVDIPSHYLEVVLRRTNWLLCNAKEARTLAGIADAVSSATMLASRNDSLDVLVRTGAQGCVVALNHRDARAVEGFQTNVVDTNGAGDVHNGVFVAELASGRDAWAAARWANAAAAMAISRLGPATCPPRQEVAAWIASGGHER
jgi:sugar/nucleoside kinase (ribokinase family)